MKDRAESSVQSGNVFTIISTICFDLTQKTLFIELCNTFLKRFFWSTYCKLLKAVSEQDEINKPS